MLQNKLLLIATFAALACTGCFMGPVADNQVTSSLSISQAQCQMTVQNDSFAGLCAQIQISNTGVQAMQGWQLTFDLPASSHLQNSWNANFVIQGQHVVVTPLADQGNLDIGTTVMLGYCASQTGTNLVATPGSCDSTQGTAITQNANADASQVASAVATTKTVVSQVGWQALEGNIAGAPCRFTTLTVDRFGSDASLVPAPQQDATLACAAVVSPSAEGFDGADLPVQAATSKGLVTSIGQTTSTQAGLQGLVLRVSAADPTHAVLTLWHNGAPKQVTLDLPANLTYGMHFYGWHWSDTGLRITVDDAVIYQQADVMAPNLRAPRWVSVAPGHLNQAAFAL